MIYADWLEDHGQHGKARRFRNQYDGKLLMTLLPPLEEVVGPYRALEPYATGRFGRTDCKDFRDCVLEIQAERGSSRFFAHSQTQESLELGPVKGGGIWFRVSVGPLAVDWQLPYGIPYWFTHPADRSSQWRNYVERYSEVTAESFRDAMVSLIRNTPVVRDPVFD
jgi:hypothetical protein